MVIHIDTQSASPIYEQIRDQVVLGIAGGKLTPDEGLPSVRRLAADLGINFHTVSKSYTQLTDEGYIAMDRQRGAVVGHLKKRSVGFIEKLKQKLTLVSAEAICNDISENDFVALCTDCYTNVKKGGTSNA
ncbi:MAG: GntR family transcriptional regulator [Oscillospiraceae bacterium]|nr:GntR family transcriptional regulator [Oscillospiraceae bacterium]